MQIDREGRFRGFPLACGIDQKKSGAVQFAITLSAAEMLNPESGEWENVEASEYEMTAYMNLIKIDGTTNEITTKQLTTVLGWDGRSFETLQETDWSSKLIEYAVGWSKGNAEYPSKLEIKFGGGELKRLDLAEIKALDQRYGAALRAQAPAKAAATPAKPAPRAPVRAPAPPLPADDLPEFPPEPGSTEIEEQELPVAAKTAPTPPRRPAPAKKYG